MGEEDTQRRITQLEARVDAIDRNGTRGMEGVRVQLAGIERDFGKMESTVSHLVEAVAGIPKPSRQWPFVIAVIGMLIPMYGLLVDLIVRGLP